MIRITAKTKFFIIIGAVFTGFTVLYWQHLLNLVSRWNHDDYSHCYLVVPVFIYLVWLVRDKIDWTSSNKGVLGLSIIFLSMLVLITGRLGSLELLIFVSIWMSLIGLFLFYFGNSNLKYIAFPFAILFFAIPYPPFINNMISQKLKLWSSSLAEMMLKVLTIPVYREGNIIDLGVAQLQIVDACSGLRYLFPTMFMALLIGRFFLRSNFSRFILFAVSPLLCLFSNSLRIAVTGILVKFIDPQLAEGFFHDFSGWLVYMFTILFLGLATFLLKKREGLVRMEEKNDYSDPFNPGELKPKLLFGKTAVIMLLFFGAFTVQSGMLKTHSDLNRQDFSIFPEQIDNWQGQRTSLSESIQRRLWADDYLSANFTNPVTDNTLQLLVSYYESQTTRKTAHAPTSCLTGEGWMLLDRRVSPPNPENGRYFPVQSMMMEKGGKRILANFWFDQRGRHITSEYLNKFYLLRDAIFMKRTDGALVRVEMIMHNNQSIDEAQYLLDYFILQLHQYLRPYIPGEE